MFLGLLLFGSFWFWTLTVGALLAIAFAVEYERPGLATLTLIGTFAALGFLGDVNVLHYALHNPLTAAVAVVGYLVVGTLWALFKWKSYLVQSVERFEDHKRQWLSSQSRTVPNPAYSQADCDLAKAKRQNYYERETVTEYVKVSEDGPVTIPEEFLAAWAKYARTELIPSVKRNKARITTWMAYWPTSVIWYLLRDWVLKLFESIFARLKGVLTGMRNRAYADVLKDMPADFKIND